MQIFCLVLEDVERRTPVFRLKTGAKERKSNTVLNNFCHSTENFSNIDFLKEHYQAVLMTMDDIDLIFSSCTNHYWTGGQASESKPRHGNLHYNEPRLCWTFQPPRQLEKVVPQLGHDYSWPTAYCSGHAVLTGFQNCRETSHKDCSILQVSNNCDI